MKQLIESKIGIEEPAKKYETTDEKKAKSYCIKCKVFYIIRPFLCKCGSNVFLRNIKGGN